MVILSLSNSCRMDTEQDTTSALHRLVERYPELYGHGLIKRYHLVRQFYNAEDSVKMDLFGDKHGENEIVILSNNRGQAYGVPFPDNDQRIYWRFYGEEKTLVPGGKTFSSEMKIAFKLFGMKENWQAGTLFNDLMFSLVQARPVFSIDSLQSTANGYPDSCTVISERNRKNIFNQIHESSWEYLNSFRDFKHARFFQFNSYPDFGRINYKITVYRDPCQVKTIYL